MPNLFITGYNEPILITDTQKSQIIDLLNQGKTNETVVVGSDVIKLSSIRFIKEEDIYKEREYEKDEIRQFERELNGRDFKTQYCYDMGYLIKNERYPDGTVVYDKVSEYNTAIMKNKALELLKGKRDYFKKLENQAFDSIINEEKITDIKDLPF